MKKVLIVGLVFLASCYPSRKTIIEENRQYTEAHSAMTKHVYKAEKFGEMADKAGELGYKYLALRYTDSCIQELTKALPYAAIVDELDKKYDKYNQNRIKRALKK